MNTGYIRRNTFLLARWIRKNGETLDPFCLLYSQQEGGGGGGYGMVLVAWTLGVTWTKFKMVASGNALTQPIFIVPKFYHVINYDGFP